MKSARETSPVRNNLPLGRDTFVGPDEDVGRVGELLGLTRLVTLTGAPGMGKTRLGVEVARSLLDRYGDGVWFVALAPLAQPQLVAQAVASALSAAGSASGDNVVEGLTARIAKDQILLVLDNCEHVLDACASLAAALLDSCPNLAILATSQERLAIAGEQVWAVSGLAIAGEATTTAEADTTETDTAEPADAVRLFAERARATDAGFELGPANSADVAEICRRLDGIPLAIELAAARVNGFSPAEIARHLDGRFAFLTGGSRAALPRHQTLRAAVDWSYELLSTREQALLRRLSIFSGGATLDAIAEVCTSDDVSADDCLDLLTTLIARSLVVADRTSVGHAFGGVHGGAQPPRVSRYNLLETIRFYGRDRLAAAGEVTRVAARHLLWCVTLAESAEPHLTGATQGEWLARLEVDHDNLRAAMAWSLDQGPTDAALRIAGALTMFWRFRSHFQEGFDWLFRAIDVSDDALQALRAKAIWGEAMLAAMLGDYRQALLSANASLALYQQMDDPRGQARALLLLGLFHTNMADNVTVLQQCIALARQADDPWCVAQALARCGSSFGRLGDGAAARPVLEESIDIARRRGDEQCLRFGLITLGHIALSEGDYRSAESALHEALLSAESPGGAYESAKARTGLAEVALGRGDYDLARRLLDEALDHARQTPAGHAMANLECVMGQLALAKGDLDEAERLFTGIQSQAEQSGASSWAAVLGLAEVALVRGQSAEAKTLVSQQLPMMLAAGDKKCSAAALYCLGEAGRLVGDDSVAKPSHQEALALRVEIADHPGIVSSLEALAGLMTVGRPSHAATILGFTEASRHANDYARSGYDRTRYDADITAVRDALGTAPFEKAWAEGQAMSVEAAVAYVSKGRGRAERPVSGVGALTDSELQVARLALQRLTNAEIAERLFVSIATVKTHLHRVFTKLSVSTRAELLDRFSAKGI